MVFHLQLWHQFVIMNLFLSVISTYSDKDIYVTLVCLSEKYSIKSGHILSVSRPVSNCPVSNAYVNRHGSINSKGWFLLRYREKYHFYSFQSKNVTNNGLQIAKYKYTWHTLSYLLYFPSESNLVLVCTKWEARCKFTKIYTIM